MTQESADRRVRQWTRRSDRPIPYGPFARAGDWWCALRDARTGLPNLLVPAAEGRAATEQAGSDPAPGDTPAAPPERAAWETPRTALLGQVGRGRAEKEWIHYKAEVTDCLIQRRQAQAQRDWADRQLQAAEKRLADLSEPKAAELAARVSGEERTGDAVRAGRRMQEHAERRRDAEAEAAQARAAVATHEAEIAALSETVRIRFEVAQTRAAMIDSYVRRRCASYLTRLVRKHADGKSIGPLIRPGWRDRPSWTTREISPDLADSTGLAAPGGSPPAAAPTGGE